VLFLAHREYSTHLTGWMRAMPGFLCHSCLSCGRFFGEIAPSPLGPVGSPLRHPSRSSAEVQQTLELVSLEICFRNPRECLSDHEGQVRWAHFCQGFVCGLRHGRCDCDPGWTLLSWNRGESF